MLRVISRPMTVPAERIALLNAGLLIILSSIPGSAAPRDFTSPSVLAAPGSTGSGGGRAASGDAAGVGCNLLLSRSYADSRSIVWPYSACNGDALAAAAIASGPMVSIRDRGGRLRG